MHPAERKAWTEIITVKDLDRHMAEIGQAEANAKSVKLMFKEYPLKSGSKLLIPGCGTCQMFEHITAPDLGDGLELTLTDINPSYLAKAQGRLRKCTGVKYTSLQDDIETTNLTGKYDAVLIVLVLQHVEWRKALESMLALDPNRFYIIIQEQDSTKPLVTVERDLAPSLRDYAKIQKQKLVPRAELQAFLNERGYNLIIDYKKEVPDNKTMAGFVFEKKI